MDDKVHDPVTTPLAAAAPEFSRCPDCEDEFRPGHLCRASMVAEIERTRAAFQISISTLGRIRNTLTIWRRGEEVAKLKEVSGMARTALKQIEELLQGSKVCG